MNDEKVLQRIKKGRAGKNARSVLRIPQWRVAKSCNCSIDRIHRWESGMVDDPVIDNYYLNLRLQLLKLRSENNAEKAVQSIEPRPNLRKD